MLGNKIAVVALLLSIALLLLSFVAFDKCSVNPYFISTSIALEADNQMQAINQRIGVQDAILKKKEQVFADSIMGVYDSVSVRNAKNDSLIELLNLESNVFRHNMIDSVSSASQKEISEAIEKFNKKIDEFCKKNGISILFGANSGSIIYGVDTKADKTKELVKYIGGTNE